MTSPRISVLLPAYNEEALLPDALARVRESFSALREDAYEIVVCDNNSTDRTAEIAAAHGARVVFEPENQIARARNTAARAAEGGWFIFVDADSFLNPQLLRATMTALESGRICGGGATLRFDHPHPGLFGSAMLSIWNWVSRTFHLAAGSCLFCLRDAWRDTGGFDETLYAGEELAFSQRLKAWGRPRGLRFRVLSETPIVTSARKLEWYGQWQLLRRVLLMARPNALRNRHTCSLWYTRPAAEPSAPGYRADEEPAPPRRSS